MKCTIDGANARIFAKAIQSLSRFGPDLFVEAAKEGFILRSINSSKSAVGTFKFCDRFFESYEVSLDSHENDENYCKISMKACLAVFKNMKQVESCQIKIENAQSKFQVQLKCRLETIKNSLISIIDEENISAAVPLDDAPNTISGSHRIFTEISSNFQATEEEITLEAQKESLNVKNYIEGSRVNDRFMRSQLKLTPGEFDNYNITEETTVTFCLREFRAFLLFAESINENLVISFHECGSPIIFKIEKLEEIKCNLIMSTLALEDVSFYDDCRKSESFNNITSETEISKKRKSSSINTTNKKSTTKHNAEDFSDRQSGESGLFQFSEIPNHNSVEVARNFSTATSNNVPIVPAAGIMKDMSTTSHTTQSSTNIQQHPTGQNSTSEVFVTFVDSDDYCIPQSPNSEKRRLRSIFSRCFESTYVPREPSPSSQVYVPNSDTED